MIARVLYGVLLALSLVAVVMMVNFWREWLSTPLAPHVEYASTRTPSTEHQHYVNGKLRTLHVWSDKWSVATVDVQTRTGADGEPWYTIFTITNPDGKGEMWSIPPFGQLRVSVTSYTAGRIYASGAGCQAEGIETTASVDCKEN